jgi:tripartite motif-containing protein 2/3
MVKCPLCQQLYKEPKVLACFHSFCKSCLERQLAVEAAPELNIAQRIVCQLCAQETQLSLQLGIEGLLSDYGLENVVQTFGQSLGTSPYSEVRMWRRRRSQAFRRLAHLLQSHF